MLLAGSVRSFWKQDRCRNLISGGKAAELLGREREIGPEGSSCFGALCTECVACSLPSRRRVAMGAGICLKRTAWCITGQESRETGQSMMELPCREVANADVQPRRVSFYNIPKEEVCLLRLHSLKGLNAPVYVTTKVLE